MHLATARTNNATSGTETTAVRVEEDRLVGLDAPDVGALLADPRWRRRASADGPELPRDTELATLVPRPDKIICLGLNYASHIAEMGRPEPQYPTLFAKYAGSLIGPADDIVLPTVSSQVDWEAELGVVIGRGGRHLSPEDALDAVAGYTVVNDITVRDWQHRTREFLSGKTFEATTPVGPHLVTSDELPPGAAGLQISCTVDGETMQSSHTGDLLFDVATTVSYISTIITLRPGDLIAMGTPGGVGAGREPQVYLRPGQHVVTEIEHVGRLSNTCVPETGSSVSA